MGVVAGLYMCDVVKKFTFAISSPDEFLYKRSPKNIIVCNCYRKTLRTIRHREKHS